MIGIHHGNVSLAVGASLIMAAINTTTMAAMVRRNVTTAKTNPITLASGTLEPLGAY
jgi:hypothetical protein